MLSEQQIQEARAKYGIATGDAPQASDNNPIPPSQPEQTPQPGGFEKGLNAVGSIAGLDVLGKTIAGGIAKFLPKPKVIAPANYSGGQDQFQKNFDQQQNQEIGKSMPTLQQNAGATLKLASTLIPVGKVVSVGKLAIQGAIAGGTYGLGQALTEKQNLKDTVITTGEYAAGGAALHQLTGYVASRLPKLLSIFSGENAGVIEHALKDPALADQGIKNGDAALRKVVQEGANQSVKLRTSFINGEAQAIKSVAKQASDRGISYSSKDAMAEFNALLDRNDIKVTRKALDFSQSKVQANPGEVNKITNAYGIMKNWDDWSLEGTHKLKQLIGGLTKFPNEGGGMSKSPVLGKLYGQMDNLIKDGLPTKGKQLYTAINQKFSQNIDLYNEVVDAFNSGDPFSKLANSLGNNKDSLRQVLEFYEKQTGKNVLPIVAGRELAAEKSAAFGFLNPRSWMDFFISPKFQGNVITTVGKVEKTAGRLVPKQIPQILNQQVNKSIWNKPYDNNQ